MLVIFPSQVTLLDRMDVQALESGANQYFDGSAPHVPNFLFVEADFIEFVEVFLLDICNVPYSK